MSIRILSSGAALPEKILKNSDLEKMVETSDAWIVKMTGIQERHILSDTESFSSLTLKAAKIALERAHITAEDINMIALGTSTPESIMPSSACILQGLLGIKECISLDLQAACSGFVYALVTTYYFMLSNPNIRYALVMGCDALSKITNWSDRATCVLFGDGFAGLVLENNPQAKSPGILYCGLGSDGTGKSHLNVCWGIGQGYEKSNETNHYIYMNGREVFRTSVNYFSQLILDSLEKSKLNFEDVDWIITHQANIRIIHAVAEKLNISKEKLVVTLDKHGNTSAASIPLAFNHLLEEKKIKHGDKVMFVGFGAGYTWGVVIFQF
ncbi:MAG: hypothetical protein ACD_44C00126G0004 [uncultured bacterium]|nr:MAG: hypothetical protein ACD_44C00126G0004 [uncultured bacterium]